MRGDVTIAAVGTLTRLNEDGTFLAFGHPLLNQGEVSFALEPAYVSYIVPSEVVPFKLADSGERALGAVTQDGLRHRRHAGPDARLSARIAHA